MCDDIFLMTYQNEEEITQYLKTKDYDSEKPDIFEQCIFANLLLINHKNISLKLGIDKQIQDMILEYLLADTNPDKWDRQDIIDLITNSVETQINYYRYIINLIKLRKHKIFRKQKNRSIRLSVKRLFKNYNSDFGGIFYVDISNGEMRFYIQEYYEPRDEYDIKIPVRIDKSNSGHTLAMGIFFGKENVVKNYRGEFFVKDNIFHFFFVE